MSDRADSVPFTTLTRSEALAGRGYDVVANGNEAPAGRTCEQCGGALPEDAHPKRRYCSQRCQNKAAEQRRPPRKASKTQKRTASVLAAPPMTGPIDVAPLTALLEELSADELVIRCNGTTVTIARTVHY